MNNHEKCEQTCTVLLNADPNNELAAVMMADLAFRKVTPFMALVDAQINYLVDFAIVQRFFQLYG